MAKPKVLIITGYGINCDEETKFAFEKAGADSEIIHVNDLIEQKDLLSDAQILVFPGGFSYGDDTGSGKGMANKIRNNLFDEILEFIRQEKLILGICNGFQVLVSLGLLPALDSAYGKSEVALLHNTKARFLCRWVKIKTTSEECVFTRGIKDLDIPIAHGEGNFYAPKKILDNLAKNDQVAFKYVTPNGEAANGVFPANPNGSQEDIAGICDPSGRIMGLMPHPERAIFWTSHPDFQKKKEEMSRKGQELPQIYEPAMKFFQNAVEYVKNKGATAHRHFMDPRASLSSRIAEPEDDTGASEHLYKDLVEPINKESKMAKIEQPVARSKSEYKQKIKANLKNVLESGFIPELGNHKAGKVRDVHFTSDKLGSPIIMVASDRVSCYDHILKEAIPYKGKILNLFAKWAFENTGDIIPNSIIESPNDYVVIHKRYKVMPFEFVVRGYVWGSMAKAYEEGEREFCGIKLSEGLLRYQKLSEPILTPATKFGKTDENVSFETVVKEIGAPLANKLKDAAIKLFNRGSELALKRGFIFLDTKYEFGIDQKGQVYLIDEANTPDSSRYCTCKEYEKYEAIKTEMQSGKYENVMALLKAKPKLKIEELSKQFVRDVLEESNFSYGATGKIPSLSEDQVIETSYRYISLYEDVTGRKFDFSDGSDVKQKLVSSLVASGHIKGGLTIILAGSDSDSDHMENIKKEMEKYGIPVQMRICSAHKQGEECTQIIKEYNTSSQPLLLVAVAGGTDALSGLASFHSVWPVVSCPPNKEEYASCVSNPPGSPNSLILRPANVAKFAAQYFGYVNKEFHKKLLGENDKKIDSLKKADEKLKSKGF